MSGKSTCCTCGHTWRTGTDGNHSCTEVLRAELDVTNRLLEERNRVLQAIPACEAHGDQCIPHALEWIAQARAAVAVPEIDYTALIHAAFKNHRYAQGTGGCIAFKHGAEWFRSVCATAHAGSGN